MSKQTNGHNTMEECFMYACFGLAVVAASVAAIALYSMGGLSELRHSVVGIGLGATGLWFAIGIFLYQDRKRQEADECIKEQLSEILERLDKCDCQRQAECRGEVVTQEDRPRSWLFGLFCGGARR